MSAQDINTIKHFVVRLVNESPLNSLAPLVDNRIFDEPLIGVANGRDPLFLEYKKIIGDFYLTPAEIMREGSQPGLSDESKKRISVICWALPFSEPIKRDNAKYTSWPNSPLWSEGTRKGEELNNVVRRELVQFLSDCGCQAIAPVLSQMWKRPDRYSSNWSERHALYAAGMGTFSLNRGFITEKGIAMRCGSVIVNTRLQPTPRKYSSHTENCLFYSKTGCGKCTERCPAKAITTDGHNKALCRGYRDKAFARLKEAGWTGPEPACGLCQTGVPCESQIPN